MGSGWGFGKKKGRGKLGYTPSAYAIVAGIRGTKPSRRALKTGLAVRPITKEGGVNLGKLLSGTTSKKRKGKKSKKDKTFSFVKPLKKLITGKKIGTRTKRKY